MKPTDFETAPFEPVCTGTVEAFAYEQDNIGNDLPARLIHHDQIWGMDISWFVKGPLLPVFKSVVKFAVRLYLEDMTPAENEYDYSLELLASDGKFELDTISYEHIKVLPPKGEVKAGTYKPTVVVQAYLTDGNPLPIAGFVEMRQLLIYEEKKPDHT